MPPPTKAPAPADSAMHFSLSLIEEHAEIIDNTPAHISH
jgi:hypothetical protein